MEIGFKLPNRTNRAQLLLMIGIGIFAAGTLGFIAGYLLQEQTSVLYALSLTLICVDSSVKRVKYSGTPGPAK